MFFMMCSSLQGVFKPFEPRGHEHGGGPPGSSARAGPRGAEPLFAACKPDLRTRYGKALYRELYWTLYCVGFWNTQYVLIVKKMCRKFSRRRSMAHLSSPPCDQVSDAAAIAAADEAELLDADGDEKPNTDDPFADDYVGWRSTPSPVRERSGGTL